MKVYKVGGAVRDHFLGLEPKDVDYLVLGSSDKELLSLGYQQVGLGFPIFIHPQTRQEYALPRGNTLEKDLFRRDLTINAMAIGEDGEIFDPYGGQNDLKSKILRHVSDSFAEDPFRVYRVLRFKAQFTEFTIAPETMELMKKLVVRDDFKTQTTERIMKELGVIFALPKPSLFFAGLKDLGALSCFFRELEMLNPIDWSFTLRLLDQVSSSYEDETVRFSALVYLFEPDAAKKLCDRIQAPNVWAEAAQVTSRHRKDVEDILELDPSSIVHKLYAMDGFRKPNLVWNLALVCEAAESLGPSPKTTRSEFFRHCFNTVKTISSKDVSPLLRGAMVGEAIVDERIKALKRALRN